MRTAPAAIVEVKNGLWAREFLSFEPPESGAGPIANLTRLPTGQGDLNLPVGDYNNPILKPEAAEILKRRGAISRMNRNFPQPFNQCAPFPMPYILILHEIQLLQQKNQVVILYMQTNQVRHVRLNGRHPERVTPSWSGDSIGHYEGESLVVDTIGVKVGPLSMVDILGTPQSAAVHVIERYRLVDYETATKTFEQLAKHEMHIRGTFAIGDGVAVDPSYRGKALQLQITVEDPNVFNMPWSAANTYLRSLGDWQERVCAENTHEYYNNTNTRVPEAGTPDF